MSIEEQQVWCKSAETYCSSRESFENYLESTGVPEGIEILEWIPERCINCFAYAFGFSRNERFHQLQGPYVSPELSISNGGIAQNILDNLSSKLERLTTGDYIVHSNNGYITHIGCLEGGDTVISKWVLDQL